MDNKQIEISDKILEVAEKYSGKLYESTIYSELYDVGYNGKDFMNLLTILIEDYNLFRRKGDGTSILYLTNKGHKAKKGNEKIFKRD